MSHIEELRDAIQELHGGEATHSASVPVFNLKGHPKANTAYAWLHDTGDPDKPVKHVAVLHVPPVVSPLTAVRAFIVQEFRSNAKA